ncbi:hypothetical protein Tco_1295139 [Tanacetum coccineum]
MTGNFDCCLQKCILEMREAVLEFQTLVGSSNGRIGCISFTGPLSSQFGLLGDKFLTWRGKWWFTYSRWLLEYGMSLQVIVEWIITLDNPDSLLDQGKESASSRKTQEIHPNWS